MAEAIMKEKYKNKAIVSSAGLKPLPTSEMDKRSRSYLETIGFQPTIHMPRKFESFNANEAKLILALDMLILSELNKKFPHHRQKIKRLNFVSYSDLEIVFSLNSLIASTIVYIFDSNLLCRS